MFSSSLKWKIWTYGCNVEDSPSKMLLEKFKWLGILKSCPFFLLAWRLELEQKELQDWYTGTGFDEREREEYKHSPPWRAKFLVCGFSQLTVWQPPKSDVLRSRKWTSLPFKAISYSPLWCIKNSWQLWTWSVKFKTEWGLLSALWLLWDYSSISSCDWKASKCHVSQPVTMAAVMLASSWLGHLQENPAPRNKVRHKWT